jgi:hypothetical protein
MTFDELINLVTSSDPEDWHTTVCWGADSGPSYRDHFNFFQVYDGQPNVLFAEAHSLVACYKPDLSVTLAWGLDAIRDFKEPWANGFADPKAASHYVDIFYNNALVFRTVYVSVDGGRAYLPLPESRDALSVPRAYNALIRLIDHIGGTRISEYDTYFKRAGFHVVDAVWPSTA